MALAHCSRQLLAAVLFSLVLLVGEPPVAFAQGLYTVTGIEVDETADTEVAAKEQGVAFAKREAFAEILRRLTVAPLASVDVDGVAGSATEQPAEELSTAPSQDGLAPIPAIPVVPEDERLEFMIRDLSFQDERFGGGRYIAEMTVRYQPQAVNQYLQRLAVPYLSAPSPTAVILPIFRDADGVKLWSDTNAWLDAWWSLDGAGTIVPYAVPLGDLSDISAIDVDRAIAVDPRAVNAIAARYNAGAVLVPLATVSEDGATVLVELSTFGSGWPSQPELLTLGPDRLAAEIALVPEEDAAPDERTARLRAAARLTLGAMEERWKAANLLRFDQEAETLTASLMLTRFEDWLEARRALDAAAPIKDWALVEMSTSVAVVTIDYVGDVPTLGQALARARFSLGPDPEADDRFILLKQ